MVILYRNYVKLQPLEPSTQDNFHQSHFLHCFLIFQVTWGEGEGNETTDAQELINPSAQRNYCNQFISIRYHIICGPDGASGCWQI